MLLSVPNNCRACQQRITAPFIKGIIAAAVALQKDQFAQLQPLRALSPVDSVRNHPHVQCINDIHKRDANMNMLKYVSKLRPCCVIALPLDTFFMQLQAKR
jgi:hypothetical protein